MFGLRKSLLTVLATISLPMCAVGDDGAVVFMYHRFGDDHHPSTNIRVEQLRGQLDYLRDNEIPVVPLRSVIESMAGGKPVPDRAVVLTVDDAYRSVYEVGFPMFRSYGFPFTVFVSTDPVDQGLPDYMTWEQMLEMSESGVNFANHGAGHLHLVRRLEGESEDAWSTRISADIDFASRRLAEELPADSLLADQFAYPYGEYDTATSIYLLGWPQHRPCSKETWN